MEPRGRLCHTWDVRQPHYVAPLRTTRLNATLGIVVNLVLLGVLIARAESVLAVLLGTAMVVVVMLQAERQGWGPLTRMAAGVAAGVFTFLVLNH